VPSRRLVTVLAAGLLPIALTACGSGKSPETYRERPTVDAARASMGDLEVRGVHVAPPTGGAAELAVGEDADVTMAVVNVGEAPDRLVEVTSDAATSVEILDKSGATTDHVDIPGLGAVGAQDFSVRLTGLTRPLRPGESVPVTIAFTRAGRKTLSVPVAAYTSPVPRPTYDVFEQPEGATAEGSGAGG
jgi:copper(I)-binding protein